MIPKITEIAKQILTKYPKFDYNDDYVYDDGTQILLIDAIQFPSFEAHRLAGPFSLNYYNSNKVHFNYYGLITIQFNPNALLSNLFKINEDNHNKNLYNYLPQKYQYKIATSFKDCNVWFNKELLQYVSDIDIQCGTDITGYTVCNNIKNDAPLYTSTEEGQKKLLSVLTENEKSFCLKWVKRHSIESQKKIFFTIPSKGRQYVVHLFGNDDCSWSKTYATLKESNKLISDLKEIGFPIVEYEMYYTN